MTFDVDVVGAAFELLDASRTYDICLLDIQLPGINGMEAAHRLREIDRQVILIFVTNMAQFAVKGYEVDALDYIIKPAQYGPLSIKLDRAAQRWRAAAESVMVALPTGTQRLLLWEIYYIEVQGHKLTYHTEKGQLPGTGTLQDAEQRLHGKGPVPVARGIAPRQILALPGSPLAQLSLSGLRSLFGQRGAQRIRCHTGGDIAHTGPADLGIHTGAKRHGQQQGGGAAFQMLCHIFPRQNARRCQAVGVGLQPDCPGRGYRQQRHGAFFQQRLGGRVRAAPGSEVPRRLCKVDALRLFQPQRHTWPNAHLPALLYKNKE